MKVKELIFLLVFSGSFVTSLVTFFVSDLNVARIVYYYRFSDKEIVGLRLGMSRNELVSDEVYDYIDLMLRKRAPSVFLRGMLGRNAYLNRIDIIDKDVHIDVMCTSRELSLDVVRAVIQKGVRRHFPFLNQVYVVCE